MLADTLQTNGGVLNAAWAASVWIDNTAGASIARKFQGCAPQSSPLAVLENELSHLAIQWAALDRTRSCSSPAGAGLV
jgi:hypothetical protein